MTAKLSPKLLYVFACILKTRECTQNYICTGKYIAILLNNPGALKNRVKMWQFLKVLSTKIKNLPNYGKLEFKPFSVPCPHSSDNCKNLVKNELIMSLQTLDPYSFYQANY